MNAHSKNNASNVTPSRPLQDRFTETTLHHAQRAKRRSIRKQSTGVFLAMKNPFPHLRTASGAALALTAIAVSTVGVCALSNWFGANPTVRQDASILHVDISSCTGPLPAGFEPTANRSNIQFKIVGSPHISASDLQQQLLIDCEFGAVHTFYNPGKAYDYRYDIVPATITAVDGRTFTVNYQWANSTQTKIFTLSANDPLYAYGKSAQLSDFHSGDFVAVAVPASTSANHPLEGTDAFATETVSSIFKTQYDLSKASGASKTSGIMYQTDNVMPLELYNQTHRN